MVHCTRPPATLQNSLPEGEFFMSIRTMRRFAGCLRPERQRLSRRISIAGAGVLCAVAVFSPAFLHGSGGVVAARSRGGEFVNTLMPQPSSLTVQSGAFRLDRALAVCFAGVHDKMLDDAVARTLGQLEEETGIAMSGAPACGPVQAQLQIDVQHPAEAVQSIDEDESYSLVVGKERVQLQAPNDLGALHGLQTLLQLVQEQTGGYVLPAVSIADKPRFKWRGLMIDCGRHFEPVPVILRTLDGMAAVKLNVFHWHLTEDQGFRAESLRFPKLQEMGSDGLYYTQSEMREVVEYAHDRGIRVVPEFDMPGHSTSWFVGYPQLASGPGPYHVERVFGVHDAAMDPTRESTYAFLDAFIEEMADIFPDAYMHIGGDESNGKQWLANPRIRAFMRKNGIAKPADLQVYFNRRLLGILKKYHKHMVGWDEILAPGLPKDAVVQSWRNLDSLRKGTEEGYQEILSGPYYLDQMESAEEHYLADPLPANSGFSAAQEDLVLGGEICMWGEHISPQTIDSRIWPRAAAIAERFWSPAAVRDVDDMYRRLWVEWLRLDALGLEQISGPQRMLRELAGSASPTELEALASVLEPVSFGQRYSQQKTDQLTPLNGLVDAVVPDPPSRHAFAESVQKYLSALPASQKDRAALEKLFGNWRQTASTLEPFMQSSPRLSGYAVRAQELGQLGQIGLEAIQYLNDPSGEPSDWEKQTLDRMDAIREERMLVRFTILDPLQKLVVAAGASRSHLQ
jgi:hexosaminidase